MNSSQTALPVEKPLSKGSAVVLVCAAIGTILLFYLFAVGSVLLVLVVLGIELLFVIAAARVGLGGPMAKLMTRHMAPLPVFFRSFWVTKRSEFRVALQSDNAPRLFELLTQLCERARAPQPQEVLLEMSVNAWVRMGGFRRGAGKTTLGIGYDLLAGLSEAEFEAVLAHELTHARLVQRGLSKWLRSGLNRTARLAGGLAALQDVGRRVRQPSELTQALFKPADWLARTCARLVAACSRQDEFAADLGAAELCGTDAMRSALLKLDPVGQAAARLPWRERVAQLQMGNGFSQWLVSELTSNKHTPSIEAKPEPFNKYATHPSLSDRLAALPPGKGQQPGFSPSAMGLLAEPDKIAEELIAEIQRVVAKEEQRDTKALNRWSRKIGSSSRLPPLQGLGLLCGLIGLIAGLVIWLTVGVSGQLLLFVAATVIPGFVCYRFCGSRESIALPVPDFAALKAAFQTRNILDQNKVKEVESAIRDQIASERKKRRKVRLLVEETYAALARCDYLRAHVAARLCLQADKKCIEGIIGFAVAAASLGQAEQLTWAIQALRKTTQLTRGSAAWGTAWALLLAGNWSQAEAFLSLARKGRSDEPTLLMLQALCQIKRGKLQSAIVSAREACNPKPRNQEYTKFLVTLLLDGGFLREAQEQMTELSTDSTTDPELMFSLVRLNLMMRNLEAAKHLTDRLKSVSSGAPTQIRLGGIYESCRQKAQATAFYTEALACGHFPEALLGLGRMETRHNKETARCHLLAALDLSRPCAEGSCGPLPIFQSTLHQLLLLKEPEANCMAWIATPNGKAMPTPLANKSLLIYSTNRHEAEQSLSKLLTSMQPDRPIMLPESITWRQAAQDQQPLGLVHSGVQGVLQ
jgi:Zn-dependent protease with chaperone function